MAGDHLIVWRFRVAADWAAAFEHAYGPRGPWAELFARDPGYRGTELVRTGEPGVYLTIDRWDAAASFQRFLARWRADYDRLDTELAGLALDEAPIGAGDTVDGAG